MRYGEHRTMANIYNIPSFIIKDAFPDTPADSTVNYRPNEVVGNPYNAKKTTFKFDFIDGNPANGDLRDAETEGDLSDQTDTEGSHVVVDGTEHYVQSMWIAGVTFTFSDGTILTADRGMRLFVLATNDPDTMTGDVIANPIDTVREDIEKYIKANPGVSLASFTIDTIRDDGPLDYTTISKQDDSFAICFTAGVLIETETGAVRVEDLRVGDMVFTLNNGYQPIRWIGSRPVSAQELTSNPKLCPVRIDAGALGENRPFAPLIVSRQHRVLIKSDWARELFGTDEVLVPAIKLSDLPGINVVGGVDIVYYHILLDSHEILLSNGTPSESLYLGAQALRMITDEAREEIAILFPEVVDGNIPAPQSRPFVERRRHVREMFTCEQRGHL